MYVLLAVGGGDAKIFVTLSTQQSKQNLMGKTQHMQKQVHMSLSC
jgi:hypothetical protein